MTAPKPGETPAQRAERQEKNRRAAERRAAALERADRIGKEVQLRRAGATLDEIAKAVGVNKATVSRDLKKAIAELYLEDTQDLVNVEVARLESLVRANWLKAMQGHIGAGTLVLRVSESKRRLLGLDAPQKVDLGVADVDLGAAAMEIMAAARLAAATDSGEMKEALVLDAAD